MIWLDVTTLLWWSTGPVGIVRTELECAAYALPHRDSIRFCAFQGNRIVEVPTDLVAERIAGIVQRKARAGRPAQSPSQGPRVSRARSIRRRLRELVRRLPSPLEQAVLRFVRPRVQAARDLVHGLRYLRSGTKGMLRPPASRGGSLPSLAAGKDFPFADGDAYVSLGLDWDDKRNDVLFTLRRAGKLRIVRMCYDMIPVKFPHFTGLPDRAATAMSRYFVDMLWTADLVLCISRQTEADFIGFAMESGAPQPPTSIVRLGADLRSERTPIREELRGVPFILFVSTIERRKNHEVLVRAYARLVEEGMGEILPRLVFVGMLGWGVQDIFSDILYDSRVKDRISILEDVDDLELSSLYDECLFTVFPSFWEGWGLGVAESLAKGKFCVSSNAGSLPEVGGSFVAYVDPLDAIGWARALRQYITHPEEVWEREAQIRAGYRNATWAEAAEAIFAGVAAPGPGTDRFAATVIVNAL